MDAEKLKEIVKAAVDDSLSEKERATALAEMQAIIAEAKSSIDGLTESLAEKDAVVAEKEAELATLGEEKAALSEGLAEKATALEEALALVENLEAEVAAKAAIIEDAEASFADLKVKFDEIEAERAAAELAERLTTRLAKLDEAGVRRTSEAAAEKQSADVNGMSDEDFELYVVELVSLKEEFSVAQATPEPSKAAGSLNFEGSDAVSLAEKYKKLGEALAERKGAKAQ